MNDSGVTFQLGAEALMSIILFLDYFFRFYLRSFACARLCSPLDLAPA